MLGHSPRFGDASAIGGRVIGVGPRMTLRRRLGPRAGGGVLCAVAPRLKRRPVLKVKKGLIYKLQKKRPIRRWFHPCTLKHISTKHDAMSLVLPLGRLPYRRRSSWYAASGTPPGPGPREEASSARSAAGPRQVHVIFAEVACTLNPIPSTPNPKPKTLNAMP